MAAMLMPVIPFMSASVNVGLVRMAQRVKQIFAVYCKYAKNSKKKCVFADFMGFFAKM